MKIITSTLLLAVALILSSCTKSDGPTCPGCEFPMMEPGDNGGGGSPSDPNTFNTYWGSSTCSAGYYIVKHNGHFLYNYTFTISGGVLVTSNFTSGFSFQASSVQNGSIISRNIYYNALNGDISIAVIYSVRTNNKMVLGQASYTDQVYTFTDYIHTCENTFGLGN